VLGKDLLLPAHQGRACENILAEAFVNQGDVVITNYHFTTTLALILLRGGRVEELVGDEAYAVNSANPFKGNMDIKKMVNCIEQVGAGKVSFVRMEALTNLIGGQPFSVANLREVRQVCDKYKITLVLDASLLGENAYFVKKREAEFQQTSIGDIIKTMCDLADIVYFSARKLSSARGGGICTNDVALYNQMKNWIPVYEGFLTYGGMSVREIEAIAVGLRETLDETMISQSPLFIEYIVEELTKAGIPVVTPAGGLGCHLDAMAFVDHLDRHQYRAGALAMAVYLVAGVRGMERGTISMERLPDGTEPLSDFELLRLAFPRRVFTLSQTLYVIDRLKWLYKNRKLIGGLKFVEEPKTLRFFNGRLAPSSDWLDKLVAKFREDFGDSL
jgi:tryptophanase